MKITLLTIGAMGDTQPFISLAVRLKQLGHSVKLGARPDFAPLAASHGIDFSPIGNPYKTLMNNADVAAGISTGNMASMLVRQLSSARQRAAFLDGLDTDALHAAEGAEAIIYKSSWLPFSSIAERLGVPSASAMFFPLTRTRAFPSFLIGTGKDLGPIVNDLNWRLTEQAVWQTARLFDNKMRKNLLNLPRLPFFGPSERQLARTPLFYAYSPSVLPRPADWAPRIRVTGYWFSDPPTGWQPPADLMAFLERGPPPVYVGFGSMPTGNPEATLDMILKTLELSGQRGILLSGWAGIGEGTTLPEYAFGVADIPHTWLFSRVCAVIHHGGAGTTGAGLRAGAPSILTPFVADQPSWAVRIRALGVGPPPIAFKDLTAENLAHSIRQATSDHSIRQRASDLGEKIRAEDGVGTAVDEFTRFVERGG